MILAIALSTLCLIMLVPGVILIYYAGIKFILAPLAALLAALLLGSLGAGLGWLAIHLVDARPDATIIGAAVGAAAGLILVTVALQQAAGRKKSP